jgi:Tol biopolymer transport system component
MTAFNRSSRLTAELPDLLADIAAPRIPDYTDDVLEITAATRQRPRWTFPERWLPMTVVARQPILAPRLPWRAIGVLLIVLALLAATLYAVGSQRRVPPPFGPARNGAIVFGNGDIYVRDSLEGATRLLVGGSTDDRSGGFTRDGTHLTYLRKVAGAADGTGERLAAVVANLDGSNAQVLTGPMIAPSVSDLSPDSSLAVVAQGDPDVGQKLYTYGTTAPGELHQIDVGDPAMMMDYPSFLGPNGKEILFRGTTPTNTGVHSGIFAVHPDGSGLRRITLTDGDPGTSYLSPQPSPDGRYVAYTDWGYTNSVHLVDLTTGADRVIDPQGNRSQGFAWFSPDGKSLLFDVYGDQTDQVAVEPVDGSGPARFLGPTHPVVDGMYLVYSFSPDGKVVVETDVSSQQTRIIDASTGGDGQVLDWLHGAFSGWQREAQ